MTDTAQGRDVTLDKELQDMIAQSDSGARNPAGLPGKLLFGVALVWSLIRRGWSRGHSEQAS